jgi:ubiquinone/menaquinone biosynthesis C-methylase UbiE
MSEQHRAAVERAFSQQASAFEDQRLNRVFTTNVEWLFEQLALDPDYLLLDVAAGTGHAARALAPFVRGVVALDATEAMLEAGKLAAEQAGIGNVVFQRGDAAALPFMDRSFDVVVSRFAVHHFEQPSLQVAEMSRCLRADGQLAIADLVCDDDPEIAAVQNRLERWRDPSHTAMLTVDGLRDLFALAGLPVGEVQTRDIDRPLTPWLQQTEASGDVVARIGEELRAELRGGPATGFHPREQDGELHFVQRFASLTARGSHSDRPTA